MSLTLINEPHAFILQGSFSVHPVVSSAVQSGDPVVALETTILTHGMPHPHNIETALAVEEEVRLAGAVPASVGVLDGVVYVGEGVGNSAGEVVGNWVELCTNINGSAGWR